MSLTADLAYLLRYPAGLLPGEGEHAATRPDDTVVILDVGVYEGRHRAHETCCTTS